MGSPCQSYEKDGTPFAEFCNQENRYNTKCKNKHPCFTCLGDRPSLLIEVSDNPTTKNAQNGYNDVDGDEVDPAFLDVEVAGLLEIIRQPDQKEPPYGVGHEFCNDER